jgi:hypothetical protein
MTTQYYLLANEDKTRFNGAGIGHGFIPDDAYPCTEAQYNDHANLAPGTNKTIVEISNDLKLEIAKSLKIAELDKACAAEKISGVWVGDYFYPTQPNDQTNLSASVLAATLATGNWTTPLWCESKTFLWDYKEHTADQVKAVGQEVKAALIASTRKNIALVEQVNACTTTLQINAINWS